MTHPHGVDRVVLLDLDGTLLDTASLVVTGLQEAIHSVVGMRPDADLIRARMGLPLRELLAGLAGTGRGDPTLELVRLTYRDYFLQVVQPRTASVLYPGVAEQLRRLAGHRVACAALTTKYRRCAEGILEASGLSDHVQVVVAPDDSGRDVGGTPTPQDLHRALRLLRWQGPPAQMALICDSAEGIALGRRAGLRTVAVTYGRCGVDELADAWPDVLAATFPDAVSAALDLTDRPPRAAGERLLT